MGEDISLHLTVEADDAASASRQAQMLEQIILEECPSVQIRRIRSNLETMDGGATLALAVLASPVLVEVVKAVRIFLVQRRSAKVVVKTSKGSFAIESATDQQINALLEFLRAQK